MIRMNRLAPAIVVACVFCATFSSADEVILNDGSKLIGIIERLADGKLRITTQFAGELEIDTALVTSIASDRPMVIGMITGDRLVGPIQNQPDENRTTILTQMGGIPVSLEDVEAIWPPDGKSPDDLQREDELVIQREAYEAKLPKWSAQIEAGTVYRDGNTETWDVRGAINIERITDVDLLRFYATGVYGEADQTRNTAEVIGGIYYEHLLFGSDRWFGFFHNIYEYDEFESLDLRAIISAGAGYYWIKESDHELKTRVGLSYQHQSFFDGMTTDDPQAEVGLNYRIDIVPWLQFVQATTWYPTFEELRDYRIVADNAFIIPLGDSDVWKLKIGARYDYNSLPSPGNESLDSLYYANILVDLK